MIEARQRLTHRCVLRQKRNNSLVFVLGLGFKEQSELQGKRPKTELI
jgi:hypothetical protein